MAYLVVTDSADGQDQKLRPQQRLDIMRNNVKLAVVMAI